MMPQTKEAFLVTMREAGREAMIEQIGKMSGPHGMKAAAKMITEEIVEVCWGLYQIGLADTGAVTP